MFRLVDPSTVSANGGIVNGGTPEAVDNFTVFVPEPGTLWLLLAAGLGTWVYGRQRRPLEIATAENAAQRSRNQVREANKTAEARPTQRKCRASDWKNLAQNASFLPIALQRAQNLTQSAKG
jgi:hypothetical protein